MSHPGIATRAEVVAAWLREHQVPPDVRAVLEAYVRTQESALPTSAASTPADTPPSNDDAGSGANGSADTLTVPPAIVLGAVIDAEWPEDTNA